MIAAILDFEEKSLGRLENTAEKMGFDSFNVPTFRNQKWLRHIRMTVNTALGHKKNKGRLNAGYLNVQLFLVTYIEWKLSAFKNMFGGTVFSSSRYRCFKKKNSSPQPIKIKNFFSRIMLTKTR